MTTGATPWQSVSSTCLDNAATDLFHVFSYFPLGTVLLKYLLHLSPRMRSVNSYRQCLSRRGIPTPRAAAAFLLWATPCVDFPGEGELCHTGRRGMPGQQSSALLRKEQGYLLRPGSLVLLPTDAGYGAAAIRKRAVLVWWCWCSGAFVGEEGRERPSGTSWQPPLFSGSLAPQVVEWVLHSPVAHSTVGLLRGNEGNRV